MKKNGWLKIWIAVFSLWNAGLALAEDASVDVPMYQVAQVGFGKSIGKVTLKDTKYGLLIIPNLKGLTPAPGTRGFHVHEAPNCDNFGLAAQGHLDPEKKNRHLGPYDDKGTLGDLPSLIIDANGTSTLPVLAPRLTLKMVEDHSLIIHMGSDNYSETPDKMGGAGDRYACGIIPVVPGTQVSNVTATPTNTTVNNTPTTPPATQVTTPTTTTMQTQPTTTPNPTSTSSNSGDTIVIDPVTGQQVPVSSLLKRKQELQMQQQQNQSGAFNQNQKRINLTLPAQANAQVR